jgi:UDP-glucose 4-epimerase
MSKKKCIVTGGAGFIGSHLIDRLLSEGHKVTVLDNFSTGRKENLAHNRKNLNLLIHKFDLSSDLTNLSNLTNIFQNTDWVFHLAALADIVPSINHPLLYHKANVDGTINVLELARKSGVKRFIYAASSSCYGIPIKYPTPETAPIQPQYPYALTKYIGEQYVLHWGKIYKLPALSMRFFNVYGPRSRTSGTYGAVFGTFLAQKLAGRKFTVVGNGKQTRDFTFVSDIVDALISAAESDIVNEVFNVGSGGTYSINRLVNLLGGEVAYIPKRPGEPDCTLADIRKIKKYLHWKPKVKFDDGVKIMLDNINYWKNAPVWTPEQIKKETQDWFRYLS